MNNKNIKKLKANPSSLVICVKPGRIMFGPNQIKIKIKEMIEKRVSRTMVYKTIVADFAEDIFSWAKKKNATADPPIVVGDTADENSQMKTSSIDFHQENCLSERIRSLHA